MAEYNKEVLDASKAVSEIILRDILDNYDLFKNVYDNRKAYAGITKLAFGPVEIWGEYLSNYYDSTIVKKISRPNISDTITTTTYPYKSRLLVKC